MTMPSARLEAGADAHHDRVGGLVGGEIAAFGLKAHLRRRAERQTAAHPVAPPVIARQAHRPEGRKRTPAMEHPDAVAELRIQVLRQLILRERVHRVLLPHPLHTARGLAPALALAQAHPRADAEWTCSGRVEGLLMA